MTPRRRGSDPLGPDGWVTRVLKPLRSEPDAFRFLIYVVVVAAVVVGLVLVVRAVV